MEDSLNKCTSQLNQGCRTTSSFSFNGELIYTYKGICNTGRDYVILTFLVNTLDAKK